MPGTIRQLGRDLVRRGPNIPTGSLDRDERSLKVLYPFIGSLPLQQVPQELLAPFVRARLDKGSSADTVNRDLAVRRR